MVPSDQIKMVSNEWLVRYQHMKIPKQNVTRIDVYETLCPQQMLVHKGGKIKNWVGSAEMSHLQNCSLKIYLKIALGGGGVGLGGGGSGWM